MVKGNCHILISSWHTGIMVLSQYFLDQMVIQVGQDKHHTPPALPVDKFSGSSYKAGSIHEHCFHETILPHEHGVHETILPHEHCVHETILSQED